MSWASSAPTSARARRARRTWVSLEEYFIESKIADLSPDYDFVSVRVGLAALHQRLSRLHLQRHQPGASACSAHGSSNRDQFNLIFFDQQEKDTNSELNTFQSRHQDMFIANYYRQDFIFPGYTTESQLALQPRRSAFHFDKNGFLVRPDPVGVFTPHELGRGLPRLGRRRAHRPF